MAKLELFVIQKVNFTEQSEIYGERRKAFMQVLTSAPRCGRVFPSSCI